MFLAIKDYIDVVMVDVAVQPGTSGWRHSPTRFGDANVPEVHRTGLHPDPVRNLHSILYGNNNNNKVETIL